MNLRTLTVAAATAIAAASSLGATQASATSTTCPKVKVGTLAVAPLGRVWHKGSNLYACTTVYGHAPKSKRVGKWTPGTRVAFNGDELAWTTRVKKDGVTSNRIWAVIVDNKSRWLEGRLAVPPTATDAEAEDTIVKVLVHDRGVAWVTGGGTVAMALNDPQEDPTAKGTLPATPTLAKKEKRLRVATYPGAAQQLADTLTLAVGSGGDGDECGAVDPYELTFQPTAGAPLTGVTWDGGWYSTNCS